MKGFILIYLKDFSETKGFFVVRTGINCNTERKAKHSFAIDGVQCTYRSRPMALYFTELGTVLTVIFLKNMREITWQSS
jgi:hypothetical protein